MDVQKLNFNYNVSLKTINCLNAIDFTYHINNYDYPYLHTHEDYWEFTVVTSGALKNQRNGKEEIITKDMLFISTPKDAHLLKQVGDGPLTIKNIICRSNAVKGIVDGLYAGYYDKLISGKKIYHLPQYMLYMIDSTITLINSYGESEWKKTNETLKATVVSLISFLYSEDLKSEHQTEKWEAVLNSLKTDEHFYTYNVNELCQRLGYSRAQLNRIFFARYGTSPHDYLVGCKLEYAASLLSYTDYSVAEICALVGYSNQAQFNKTFKMKFGLTPLEYRKKQKTAL